MAKDFFEDEDKKVIDSIKPYIKWLVIIGICLIIFVNLLLCFFIVPAGYQGVVFNSFTGVKPITYGEGFHLKAWIFEKPTLLEVRTRVYNDDASAASKDLQIVSTKVALNYHINKESVYSLFKNIGPDYESRIINPAIQETVKAITARHNAEDLIKDRETVKGEIRDELKNRLNTYFIVLDELSITNFDFSEQFNKAIEEKVSAEQNALKEQNNLKVVQFMAQQKIEQAKGDAEAIKIVNEELMKSPQYINFLMINKWDSHLPLVLGGNSILSITGNMTR